MGINRLHKAFLYPPKGLFPCLTVRNCVHLSAATFCRSLFCKFVPFPGYGYTCNLKYVTLAHLEYRGPMPKAKLIRPYAICIVVDVRHHRTITLTNGASSLRLLPCCSLAQILLLFAAKLSWASA